MRSVGRTIASLSLLFILMAPLAVHAATYTVTITLTTADGRVLWALTTRVETTDSTLTVNVPQKLYDLLVEKLGTDSFTTPFSVPVAQGALILSVTSDPSGLTVKLVPVPPGEVVVDRSVNIVDAATLAFSYGLGPGDDRYNAMADFNLSGRVDIFDAAVLAFNYGLSY